MQTQLPQYDVVLLGVGHTNAHVLRMWKMKPLRRARLTCVSNFSTVTYSGMLPGVLTGQYPPERMQIDLVRLCAAAGARLIVDEVTGLDAPGRRLLFRDRPALPFDVLSIGIGSIPRSNGVDLNDPLIVPIKPMQTFRDRLEDRVRETAIRRAGGPLRVVVVGGGAGGVEIAMCLPSRLGRLLDSQPYELTLVNADSELVVGSLLKTGRLARQVLESRGARLELGRRVTGLADGAVALDDGRMLPADIVLWATSATAPPLLGKLGLPQDDAGFLLTRPTLQTVADRPIFAVGDSGTIEGRPIPKAGVYAVRQGPVLWNNIQRILRGEPLEEFRPQTSFLKLLNTGDGRAIAEYKRLAWRSRAAWTLKDFIDSRFMDKYQDYRPTPMPASPEPAQMVMRCAGCGGKVGGPVLSRVLRRLDVTPSEHVLVGLEQPDDAAVIRPPDGRPVTVTVDFFTAPLDDPYSVGRIAALNALSDVYALGARPLATLALATIPPGSERQQEQLLYEVLAGSQIEFQQIDTPLVGGHTIEGPQLTIGFTVLADQGTAPPRTKGRLKAGDLLLLTKPLGTGVLLAAHMQARCRAEWMEPLLANLLLSNGRVAPLLDEFDIAAVTDVTGFGLAGHLLEMLQASGLAAELTLDAIPLLPGTEELIDAGIQSTLAPANRSAEAEVDAPLSVAQSPRFAALFDPQTNGGLLLGVAEQNLSAALTRLAELGGQPSAVIGRVVERAQDGRAIRIR